MLPNFFCIQETFSFLLLCISDPAVCSKSCDWLLFAKLYLYWKTGSLCWWSYSRITRPVNIQRSPLQQTKTNNNYGHIHYKFEYHANVTEYSFKCHLPKLDLICSCMPSCDDSIIDQPLTSVVYVGYSVRWGTIITYLLHASFNNMCIYINVCIEIFNIAHFITSQKEQHLWLPNRSKSAIYKSLQMHHQSLIISNR